MNRADGAWDKIWCHRFICWRGQFEWRHIGALLYEYPNADFVDCTDMTDKQLEAYSRVVEAARNKGASNRHAQGWQQQDNKTKAPACEVCGGSGVLFSGDLVMGPCPYCPEKSESPPVKGTLETKP